MREADLEIDEDQISRLAGHIEGGGNVVIAAATEELRDGALSLVAEIARAARAARTVN